MKKGLDERINEGVLQYVDRMERVGIAKKVGRARKRWIDTVKECSRKTGLDVRQTSRMVQDRCKWRGGTGV